MDGEAILDFIDGGHDVILAVDSQVSDEFRNLASDIGVDIEPRGSAVMDYTDYVLLKDSVDPQLIVSDVILDSPAVFGQARVTVSYSATGQSLAA